MSSIGSQDKFSNFQNGHDNFLSLRDREIKRRALGISEADKLPIKSVVKVGIGEHAATEKMKIDRVKFFLKDFVYVEPKDREVARRSLRHIDKYHLIGLQLGIFFGTVSMLLPGIRRLPFYLRIPIGAGVFTFCVRWGKNYGLDLANMRFNPLLETIERENGVRNYQTSF